MHLSAFQANIGTEHSRIYLQRGQTCLFGKFWDDQRSPVRGKLSSGSATQLASAVTAPLTRVWGLRQLDQMDQCLPKPAASVLMEAQGWAAPQQDWVLCSTSRIGISSHANPLCGHG